MTNREVVESALRNFADPARRDVYFDLYAPDVVLHGYDGVEPGLASVKQFYAGIWAAFPDARVTVEEFIECGDRVVVRFALTGTHQGTFNGIPATGRAISMPGMTVLRFANGRCVERWSVADSGKMLMQLGVLGGAS